LIRQAVFYGHVALLERLLLDRRVDANALRLPQKHLNTARVSPDMLTRECLLPLAIQMNEIGGDWWIASWAATVNRYRADLLDLLQWMVDGVDDEHHPRDFAREVVEDVIADYICQGVRAALLTQQQQQDHEQQQQEQHRNSGEERTAATRSGSDSSGGNGGGGVKCLLM
jgi:hypothetical protein